MKTAYELLKENECLREKLKYYIRLNEELTKKVDELTRKDARPTVYVKNNELTCRIYASDEAMKKAGIPEENREFIVEL